MKPDSSVYIHMCFMIHMIHISMCLVVSFQVFFKKEGVFFLEESKLFMNL